MKKETKLKLIQFIINSSEFNYEEKMSLISDVMSNNDTNNDSNVYDLNENLLKEGVKHYGCIDKILTRSSVLINDDQYNKLVDWYAKSHFISNKRNYRRCEKPHIDCYKLNNKITSLLQ